MTFFNSLIPSSACQDPASGTATLATRRPAFEVAESEGSYDLTISLPGVAKDGIEITDLGGELRVSGKRAVTAPAGAVALHRESSDSSFELVLEHDSTIDPSKIEAELKDGLLHLKLAKAESAKPRKIAVG